MPKGWSTTKGAAFSTVEVLLSVSLFALLVTGLAGSYLYGEEAASLAGKQARAGLIAEEGLEAVRNIRDAGYVNLSNGTFGLSRSGNQWSFLGTSDVTDIFTRTVTISQVDTKRKNITSTVTWQQNPQRTGTVSVASRLTYWQAMGTGNWANPNTRLGALDLNNVNDGQKVAFQGNYAYIVRTGGSPIFAAIDVTTPASPVLVGSLNLSAGSANIFVAGNYAYVSDNDNNAELKIINISNPAAPSVVGTFNAAGTADGNGLVVVGTTAYLVRSSSASDELQIINVANPAAPTFLGSLDLGDTGNEITVIGNYAYIATSNNARELQVVNISNPALPTLTGFLDLPGIADAVTLAAFTTTVVVGQGNTMYVVDVANPAAPAQLGTYGSTDAINDMALGNGNTYVFLGTVSGTSELRVVDISSPSAPAFVGGFNAAAALNGIAYDPDTDHVYAAAAENTAELTIYGP